MIPMQINSNDLDYLVGDYSVLENAVHTPALPTFSNEAVEFLSALSKEILKDKRSRNNVDVMSYAYWIRKASLEEAKASMLIEMLELGEVWHFMLLHPMFQ